MKKYFYMAVAAIAVLSSCSNYDEFEQNQTGKQALVFTATMEGSEGTRATYDSDKKCASWEVGDKISINGKTYSAQEGAGTNAIFKADGEDAAPIADKYMAYFPASLYNDATTTLPANVSETWVEDKFNMPMYATSTTTSLSFKNLCGVLKITVTNAQLTSVKSITVSSTNCATSGAFTVDANNAAVLTDASKTANTVTVTYDQAVTTDATGKVFYVAIPAQTYKNLSIAVSDGETTKVMTTRADQDITVARSKIYPITFDSSLTTTGTAERTGGNVKWIQLWKDGPKFAEYNVGVTDDKAESYGGYYEWADNIASSQWGSNWRMPTKEEFKALLDNCTVEWTTIGGKNGRKFTSKGAYTSNSVFLPAAGVCSDGHIVGNGVGYYWASNTPSGSLKAYYLGFNSGDQYVSNNNMFNSYSVRAVLAK